MERIWLNANKKKGGKDQGDYRREGECKKKKFWPDLEKRE